jgi:carbonic anhydrase
MRLFEAILEANQRALRGDASAGVRPSEFQAELPVVALSCIDVRLNPLLPEVLGLPEAQFIWLRNAGNIISGPTSSTMRSMALACVVKGGKEIAIIGHTDCQVGKMTTLRLLEGFKELGVERHALPENLAEFFGVFGSERQNVLKAVDVARSSPLIGPKIPVHGLLVDIGSGAIEWLVNGYEFKPPSVAARWNEVVQSAGQTLDAFKALTDFKIGDTSFADTKIGEAVSKAGDWVSEKLHQAQVTPAVPPAHPVAPPAPPKLPLPPTLKPKLVFRKPHR